MVEVLAKLKLLPTWHCLVLLFIVNEAVGVAPIFTVISRLKPSQPNRAFCETYHLVLPGLAVDGTGAVPSPMPPILLVYHSNVWPGKALAVKGVEVANWQ